MKNKGFAPIAIILLIVAAAAIGGGVWYWQKNKNTEKQVVVQAPVITENQSATSTQQNIQDETVDWKTYRNDEYGFEIKYPSDFDLFLSKLNPPTGIRGVLNFIDKKKSLYFYIQWSIGPHNYKDSAGYYKPQTVTNVISNELITIGNLQAVKVVFGPSMGGSAEEDYYFGQNSSLLNFPGNVNGYNVIYEIKFLTQKIVLDGTPFDNFHADLINSILKNQILSTFKFTK